MILISTVIIMALWWALILFLDPDGFGHSDTPSELQPANPDGLSSDDPPRAISR